jgi:hypothetical protein
MNKKTADQPSWQADYLKELQRTLGDTKGASFEVLAPNGRYVMKFKDGIGGRTVTRKEVLDMTERLKARPDHKSK